jgi:chromosome segregation ATPase
LDINLVKLTRKY